MLTSLALIFIVGMLLGAAFTRLRLPGLLGMLLTGILLGPYGLNLVDAVLLGISADLRQLALVIILTRAGLSLELGELKKVGRPAMLMCFVPACMEIAGMVLLAPRLLGISTAEAALMGSVIAAVSPAVIVPGMLKMIEEEYGTDKGIPQMIMAGASVDDVFVIVLFTTFILLVKGEALSVTRLATVPLSILLGIGAGGVLGWLLCRFFRKLHIRDSAKVLVLFAVAFLLVEAEKHIYFSGLVAVMAVGAAVLRFYPTLAARLSVRFSRLWVAAEILLFVLVGVAVNPSLAIGAGLRVVALIFAVLLLRMVGVLICLIRTPFNWRERLFCMIAYIPKATVQAAIGGIPLAMGLDCGSIILAVAVMSILITAPLGAIGIAGTYKKLTKSAKI